MKWAGAILLVLASYFLGIRIADEEKKRLVEVESLLSLLKFMRRRMETERASLFAVFTDFDDAYLGSIGFLKILCSDRNPKTAWSKALTLLKCDEEISRELAHFGCDLGALPLEDQLSKLENCILALEEKRSVLRAALPNKQKATKTVCLLAGALAAIIMI